MCETVTNLTKEDIAHIAKKLVSQRKPLAVYEIELRERMVHIEEDLKHQHELIKTILEQMDLSGLVGMAPLALDRCARQVSTMKYPSYFGCG